MTNSLRQTSYKTLSSSVFLRVRRRRLLLMHQGCAWNICNSKSKHRFQISRVRRMKNVGLSHCFVSQLRFVLGEKVADNPTIWRAFNNAVLVIFQILSVKPYPIGVFLARCPCQSLFQATLLVLDLPRPKFFQKYQWCHRFVCLMSNNI